MALQTVSQILAPTNAPYVNGATAGLKFAPAFLVSLYQGLIEKDGKGIDDNFVSSEAAEENTQIVVHRIRPVKINPREIGSSKNGAYYSQNQHYVTTESVAIEILQALDDPILIPRFQKDRIPVDVLAEQIKIFSDRLATILNGATFASKFLSTYVAKANGEEINETVFDLTDNDSILPNLILANGKLDEGDEAHDIDIFPRNTRICVVKTTFGPILKAKGIINLGGANELYRIIKNAGANGDGERLADDGYIGEVDGVEVREISNVSLKHASLFLGFPEYEFKNSSLIGYIASSYANARGVSTSKQTQVVDEINGQGSRILPYVVFGVASWYQKGNSFLVEDEIDVFKGLTDLIGSGITFKVKGAGSRLFPVFSALAFTSSTVATLTATALDDWGTDHLKGAYYVVSTAPIKTVDAFIKATEVAGAVKDTANLSPTTGGTITLASALTSGTSYLNVLAVADDGSCSLISKLYTA